MSNFTSQICTTREQSQRLLELGLKPETADMAWVCVTKEGLTQWVMTLNTPKNKPNIDIPAWSLHRLIEMFHENILITKSNYIVVDNIFDFDASGNLYDNLISAFQHFFPEQYLNE